MGTPIEDVAEDLRDYQRPPGPSPREVRRRWAEEGNIQPIMDLIRRTPWSGVSIGEQLQNLAIACRAGAKADPEGFSREVFGEMVGLNAYLTLRLQLYVAERVVGRGPMPCTPMMADLSPDVVERLLPRLADAQRGMAEILHAQAGTARMWALARAREAQAGRAAAAAREVPSREPTAGGKAGRSVRKAVGAEGRDGVVASLPVRGRRRG